MSAQPDHAPVTPYAPAPGAPTELLAQLRADRRAERWVPAFEREWTAALEESRRTFSLAGLYEVVQVWQGRVASASAVDAFLARQGRDRVRGHGGDPEQAPVTGQQRYAVRLSPTAAKVLDALPEHAEQMVWDVLDAAAANPWGFPQWDAGDPQGEDVRIASVGQLSVVFFTNRAMRHLSVLDIVWFG